MAKITIDGTEYDYDDLSDEVKAQLASIRFVDSEIQRIQLKLAALQTARNAYGRAVQDVLGKNSAGEEEIEILGDNLTFDDWSYAKRSSAGATFKQDKILKLARSRCGGKLYSSFLRLNNSLSWCKV